MSEALIVALITGGASLLGVIISNGYANNKMQSDLKTHQAVTDERLKELTHEVNRHNNFAEKLPRVEGQVKDIERRLEILERFHLQQ